MNKKLRYRALVIFPLSFCINSVTQADGSRYISRSPSLQGYTGALNVPSAFTAEQGNAVLQFSDAFITASDFEHSHSVIGNFGLLPYLEAGGRITWDSAHADCFETDCGVRDLSANLKLSAPFIPEDWFSVAIGAQDFGGQANFFSANYLVASKQFRYARVDIGAGKSDQPGRYLDGTFGAIELQPWSWLGLIAEYDAQETNLGFRLNTPDTMLPWGLRPSLKVMAYSDREGQQNTHFASFSVDIPLGTTREHYAHPQPGTAHPDVNVAQPTAQTAEKASGSTPADPADVWQTTSEEPDTRSSVETQAFYDALAAELAKAKFENVLVGERSRILYVALENNQYNRNEFDAVAVALKRISHRAKSRYRQAHLILRNEKIALLDIVVQPDNYLDFLANDYTGAPLFLDAQYPEAGILGAVHWYAESSYGFALKPRFAFSPGLVTVIANEHNVVNYSASLQTDMVVSLWQGALVSATYNMPVDETEEFERFIAKEQRKGAFYGQRQQSSFEEYEAQQTLKITDGLFTTFHAGHFMRDYDGAYNQTVWLSAQGSHKLAFRVGNFSHEENPLLDSSFRLMSYRYFFNEHDVSVEGTYGEFLEGSKGYRVDTKFWFGDTAVTLEYKNTDAEFVGIRWTLPLTPRRDILTPYGQIKGKENWNYGLHTRIHEDANTLNFGTATVPRARNEVERVYLNNDRLSPAYLKNHWKRLREAAQTLDP